MKGNERVVGNVGVQPLRELVNDLIECMVCPCYAKILKMFSTLKITEEIIRCFEQLLQKKKY